MSEEQLPDWLLSMRGQSLDEPLDQQADVPPRPAESLQEAVAGPLLEEAESAPEQAAQPDSDMMGFLRDMVPDEELADYSYKKEEKIVGVIPGMKPWQSLVLVVLFCLDVIVCGCMALAMLGRIGF
jgi:hypothetical protein